MVRISLKLLIKIHNMLTKTLLEMVTYMKVSALSPFGLVYANTTQEVAKVVPLANKQDERLV